MHFDRISVLKCNFCRLVETENIGRAHVEFSQHLMEQVEKSMREFREEQKNKRKSVQFCYLKTLQPQPSSVIFKRNYNVIVTIKLYHKICHYPNDNDQKFNNASEGSLDACLKSQISACVFQVV